MSRAAKWVVIFVVINLLTLAAEVADGGRRRIHVTSADQELSADWQTETWFGRQLAARILGTIPLWDKFEANKYLNLVGRSVAIFSASPGAVFTFAILDSEKVNAFATPGGYVFITKGALLLMKDEAELAGVLGHEIAHVSCHHMATSLGLSRRQESTLGGLAVLVGGATGSYRQVLSQGMERAMNLLLEKGYQQNQELEADRIGIQLAVFAGYRKDGLLCFLKRAQRFEPAESSDQEEHPRWKVRMEALENTMEQINLESGAGKTMKERFNAMFAPLLGNDRLVDAGSRAE